MVMPVILGMDVNAYGMARMFHMSYGIKSLLVGQGRLWMTDKSSILDIHIIKDLMSEKFSERLIEVAKTLPNKKLILIATSDAYAEMAIKYKEKLLEYFFMPFADESLLNKLVDKKDFYDTCNKYNLPYPKTLVIDRKNYKDIENPFGYPSVLKASSSIEYFSIDFDGKKKAYILKNDEEFRETLKNIYSTNYSKEMILQEFISGDDSKMHVLNAYVSRNGEVKLLSLGNVALEDPTPLLIGNYLAILPKSDEGVYKIYKDFLENINYTGFANFDMKYDERDKTYKVFEINLRQGRSSFFSYLHGASLAAAVYNDAIDENSKGIIKPDKDFLWLGANGETVIKYIKDEFIQEEMRRLIDEKKYGMTLEYDKDKSILRNRAVNKYYNAYDDRLNEYLRR